MHKCAQPKEAPNCRFNWGDEHELCGKIVKCLNCGEKLNYMLGCVEKDCPHIEKKRWFKSRGYYPGISKRGWLV